MQLVNDTEDTIVLDPGEAITFTSTVRNFEGSVYRVSVDRVSERMDKEELTGVEDILEARREMQGEI